MHTESTVPDGEVKIVNAAIYKYAEKILNDAPRGKNHGIDPGVVVAVYSNYDEKTVEVFHGNYAEKILPYLGKPGYNVTAYTSSGSHRLRLVSDGKVLNNQEWEEY